jgi:hypothetical protein
MGNLNFQHGATAAPLDLQAVSSAINADLLQVIISYLGYWKDIWRLGHVCREWRAASLNAHFWLHLNPPYYVIQSCALKNLLVLARQQEVLYTVKPCMIQSQFIHDIIMQRKNEWQQQKFEQRQAMLRPMFQFISNNQYVMHLVGSATCILSFAGVFSCMGLLNASRRHQSERLKLGFAFIFVPPCVVLLGCGYKSILIALQQYTRPSACSKTFKIEWDDLHGSLLMMLFVFGVLLSTIMVVRNILSRSLFHYSWLMTLTPFLGCSFLLQCCCLLLFVRAVSGKSSSTALSLFDLCATLIITLLFQASSILAALKHDGFEFSVGFCILPLYPIIATVTMRSGCACARYMVQVGCPGFYMKDKCISFCIVMIAIAFEFFTVFLMIVTCASSFDVSATPIMPVTYIGVLSLLLLSLSISHILALAIDRRSIFFVHIMPFDFEKSARDFFRHYFADWINARM